MIIEYQYCLSVRPSLTECGTRESMRVCVSDTCAVASMLRPLFASSSVSLSTYAYNLNKFKINKSKKCHKRTPKGKYDKMYK